MGTVTDSEKHKLVYVIIERRDIFLYRKGSADGNTAEFFVGYPAKITWIFLAIRM